MKCAIYRCDLSAKLRCDLQNYAFTNPDKLRPVSVPLPVPNRLRLAMRRPTDRSRASRSLLTRHEPREATAGFALELLRSGSSLRAGMDFRITLHGAPIVESAKP